MELFVAFRVVCLRYFLVVIYRVMMTPFAFCRFLRCLDSGLT